MQNSYICEKVEEYIQQIIPLFVMHSLNEHWRPVIIDTIADVYDELKKHCVMLIFYKWYHKFSEKNSIRFYVKNLI